MAEHEITDEQIKKKHKEFDDRIRKVLEESRGQAQIPSFIDRLKAGLKGLSRGG